MKQMKRAVIFDFDGTIADSFEYVYGFLKQEAHNTREYSAQQQHDLRRMSMRRLALHLGVPVWRMPYTYIRGRRIMRAHMEHVKIFPGMAKVITQLHRDGVQLFIASSNSKRNLHHSLKHYGLSQYFTAVVGGAGFTGKRSAIRRLLVRYRLPKATTWYVGDEMSDVVAATAAGIPCLAVTWGFADPEKMRMLEPSAIADHANDIPKILENAWKKYS